jgi:ABC-type uncharacterized transport system permease subunit
MAAIAGGWLWARLPKRWIARLPDGAEVLWIAVAIGASMALCASSAASIEAALFGGSFPAWLERSTGLAFDQRNAVVVGIAMGFAVIPIIFAISEDAFSNVPAELAAGSLALGANRWQTVVRVVLPTASPGIFSAIMIGFGRAVGETMIVLMATGNTPIMSWSPFDGFRRCQLTPRSRCWRRRTADAVPDALHRGAAALPDDVPRQWQPGGATPPATPLRALDSDVDARGAAPGSRIACVDLPTRWR